MRPIVPLPWRSLMKVGQARRWNPLVPTKFASSFCRTLPPATDALSSTLLRSFVRLIRLARQSFGVDLRSTAHATRRRCWVRTAMNCSVNWLPVRRSFATTTMFLIRRAFRRGSPSVRKRLPVPSKDTQAVQGKRCRSDGRSRLPWRPSSSAPAASQEIPTLTREALDTGRLKSVRRRRICGEGRPRLRLRVTLTKIYSWGHEETPPGPLWTRKAAG
mmetsp:Transcript_33622/g.103801  ORF Transcript_33622/g.103801 Transcript_33622/m.103801 type:complete len:217 (-) Transcript_33622:530-1180(-)